MCVVETRCRAICASSVRCRTNIAKRGDSGFTSIRVYPESGKYGKPRSVFYVSSTMSRVVPVWNRLERLHCVDSASLRTTCHPVSSKMHELLRPMLHYFGCTRGQLFGNQNRQSSVCSHGVGISRAPPTRMSGVDALNRKSPPTNAR